MTPKRLAEIKLSLAAAPFIVCPPSDDGQFWHGIARELLGEVERLEKVSRNLADDLAEETWKRRP